MEKKKSAFRSASKARRMRTVRMLASEGLFLGAHKRRTALCKVIKVVKELTRGHGRTSFVMMVHIIPPFAAFVKRFWEISSYSDTFFCWMCRESSSKEPDTVSPRDTPSPFFVIFKQQNGTAGQYRFVFSWVRQERRGAGRDPWGLLSRTPRSAPGNRRSCRRARSP